MADTSIPGVTSPTASMDDIDAVLGTLDIDAADDAAEIEEIIEEAPADLAELEIKDDPADEELRALEVDLTKAEVYEAATSEVGLEEPVAVEKKAKAPKEKKAKAPAAPKMERDLTALPASAFVLTEGADEEADKTGLLAKRPSQKKIAEKFDATIAALHAGRKASVYVMDCFAVLKDKKTATSSDLVAALKTKGYSDGTARSQAGQIMVLFNLLGIATRTGQTLTLNEDSVFAQKLVAVA
jgi:hypothetical protein